MNMLIRHLLGAALLLAAAGPAHAQPAAPAQAEPTREVIFCFSQMTHEEREAYRQRMAGARGPEERANLRAAHRADMQARARERGGEALCDMQGRNAGQGLQYRGGRDANRK